MPAEIKHDSICPYVKIKYIQITAMIPDADKDETIDFAIARAEKDKKIKDVLCLQTNRLKLASLLRTKNIEDIFSLSKKLTKTELAYVNSSKKKLINYLRDLPEYYSNMQKV